MSQYITESKIKKETLALSNIPIPNNTAVKVIIIPKVELNSLLYDKAIELSKSIKGNMSNDIINDRN